MNSRRFATETAALCQACVLVGLVVTGLAGLGSAGIEKTGAAAIADHPPPSLAEEAELAYPPQVAAAADGAVTNTAVTDAAVANTDVAAMPVASATTTDTTAASDESESFPDTALIGSPQVPSPETPPVQVATASSPDPLPDAKEAVSSVRILDECLVVDTCVDRYLWALYQRTPKEDSIKVPERRKVTVKKRGKMVTVTKSFTRLVDEDFAWKDPKAAEKAGMPMMDYVIGGMDRGFRLKLFHMLRAAEEAGLSPGITSAFRDDYRQTIASGLKAASNRSYHGGSLRGGYGHGLAADVVSINGGTRDERWTSSESFWKWIDVHGKEFGIGRPYLDRDPPHVAPIDGKEYAAHHGGTKTHHAASDLKKGNLLAARHDRAPTKHSRTARSSKIRTI
ncbi:MAG: peptidase M15 [Bradyrhizobium sp.]|jgi:hypothetical protein